MVSPFKRICVSPDFARLLEVKAAEAGKPLIHYTRDLARDQEVIKTPDKIKPKKQDGARFFDEFKF